MSHFLALTIRGVFPVNHARRRFFSPWHHTDFGSSRDGCVGLLVGAGSVVGLLSSEANPGAGVGGPPNLFLSATPETLNPKGARAFRVSELPTFLRPSLGA